MTRKPTVLISGFPGFQDNVVTMLIFPQGMTRLNCLLEHLLRLRGTFESGILTSLELYFIYFNFTV